MTCDFYSGEAYIYFKTWNDYTERHGRRLLKATPHICIAGRVLLPCNDESAPVLENQCRHIISGEYYVNVCMALGYSERHARRKLRENNYYYLKESGVIYLKEPEYHRFISDNFSRPQIQFV